MSDSASPSQSCFALALRSGSLYTFLIFISNLFPSLLVFLSRILVYKMWTGMRLKFFMLFVRVECLVCSGFPQYSPIFQVAVIPFEIDVPWYVNLDDCAFPLL